MPPLRHAIFTGFRFLAFRQLRFCAAAAATLRCFLPLHAATFSPVIFDAAAELRSLFSDDADADTPAFVLLRHDDEYAMLRLRRFSPLFSISCLFLHTIIFFLPLSIFSAFDIIFFFSFRYFLLLSSLRFLPLLRLFRLIIICRLLRYCR